MLQKLSRNGVRAIRSTHLSFSLAGPWSSDVLARSIANHFTPPLPIESLSEQLKQPVLRRGVVVFGEAGVELGRIASDYPNMQWWVSEHGLNITTIEPALDLLSEFDKFAGNLMIGKVVNGRLPKNALFRIAGQLDDKGFSPAKQLEPAQRSSIKEHNVKYSKKAIKTFQQACNDKRFVRSVRQRLWRARARVLKASAVSSTMSAI